MGPLVTSSQKSFEAYVFLIRVRCLRAQKGPFGIGEPELNIWDPESIDRREASKFCISCRKASPLLGSSPNYTPKTP